MKRLKSTIAFVFGTAVGTFGLAPALATGGTQNKIRNHMSAEIFRMAGLHKLSATEMAVLDIWFDDYMISFATAAIAYDRNTRSGQVPATASPRNTTRSQYRIELAHNDELFIINGETYKAKTYCFRMRENDPIIFIEGSPYGACVSAEVLNTRTNEKCDLWCE